MAFRVEIGVFFWKSGSPHTHTISNRYHPRRGSKRAVSDIMSGVAYLRTRFHWLTFLSYWVFSTAIPVKMSCFYSEICYVTKYSNNSVQIFVFTMKLRQLTDFLVSKFARYSGSLKFVYYKNKIWKQLSRIARTYINVTYLSCSLQHMEWIEKSVEDSNN